MTQRTREIGVRIASGARNDLTEEEPQALHETLSKSWTSAHKGKLRPAAAIISELRRKG